MDGQVEIRNLAKFAKSWRSVVIEVWMIFVPVNWDLKYEGSFCIPGCISNLHGPVGIIRDDHYSPAA